MKISIVGATGFVGQRLVPRLADAGHDVVVLSRSAGSASARFPGSQVVEWDTKSPFPAAALDGAGAVVNLAGENVASGRWTAKRKRELRDSRVGPSRLIADAIRAAEEAGSAPGVLVNASAIGYYGPRGDETLDETAAPGDDFLARICGEWEDAVRVDGLQARVVLTRVGIVLGEGGGALAKMLTPFKLGAGGPIGSGRQWMSWVHIEDLVGMITHAIEKDAVAGPMNGTAPNPVRNRDFGRTLGKVLGRPAFMPMPGFALRILVGEFADVLLHGQKVLPKKALDTGYDFRFPELEGALRDVLGRPAAAGKAS